MWSLALSGAAITLLEPVPHDAITIQAAIDGAGSLGPPTLGISIQPHENLAPTIISFFRRTTVEGGRQSSSWTAVLQSPSTGSPSERVESGSCQGLDVQIEAIGTLPPPSLLSPPDPRPPVAVVGAPLYTVWGRSRQDAGGSQITRVTTSTGPYSAWSRDVVAVLEACLDAARP